jgi:hypothetical protein
MTDEEAIEQVKAGLEEIRESPTQYGQVHLIVAGGEVKFVNVEKPPRVKKMQERNSLEIV